MQHSETEEIERRIEGTDYSGLFNNDPLYDESPTLGNQYEVNINPELSPSEIKKAVNLAPLSRGVMLVTGVPGSGKGLFSNAIAWKMNHYFGKRILLDYRPRRLMGRYTPFNETMFINELEKMSDAAKGNVGKALNADDGEEVKPSNSKIKRTEEAASKWMSDKGEVLLQNSVLVLDEFWRYMYNRRPHNPMGILVGGILKVWRHLDILIIGVAPQSRELDRFSCLPYVTHEVRCSWSLTHPNSTIATIRPVRFISGDKGVLNVEGKRMKLRIDGKKPREELKGKGYFDLFVSKNPVSIATGMSL